MAQWRDSESVQRWLAEHPDHQPWADTQNQLWELAVQYRDDGWTLTQTAAHLGQTPDAEQQPPEDEDITILKQRNQEQHDAIERLQMTCTQLQHRIDHVDFNDLHPNQQRHLYDQARRRLKRRDRNR